MLTALTGLFPSPIQTQRMCARLLSAFSFLSVLACRCGCRGRVYSPLHLQARRSNSLRALISIITCSQPLIYTHFVRSFASLSSYSVLSLFFYCFLLLFISVCSFSSPPRPSFSFCWVHSGTIDLPTAHVRFLKQLRARNANIVFVSFGSPYVATSVPPGLASTLVCAYDNARAVQEVSRQASLG